MAITKERKENLVAQYTEILSGSDGFVIVQSRGMTVKQAQELRAKIRETEGEYLVTKNTLFRIALKNAGWTVPEELIQGPVAVAFAHDNFPVMVKAILKFIKDEKLDENARITGGILNEEVLDDQKVDNISKLPSLDELRSQLAGLIVQPATGMVGAFNAATGQVVNILDAFVRENTEGDAA